MKRCPIPGCTWQVSDDRLMCAGHWKMVPGDLHRKVNGSFAKWRRAKSTRIALDAIEDLRDAQKQAIDAVTAQAPLL